MQMEELSTAEGSSLTTLEETDFHAIAIWKPKEKSVKDCVQCKLTAFPPRVPCSVGLHDIFTAIDWLKRHWIIMQLPYKMLPTS